MKVALVSAQANPLALGRPGTGGRHTHVAALAGALAALGHEVAVYVRRDDKAAPESVPFGPGVTVEHLDAGPAKPLGPDAHLPLMGDLGRAMLARWEARDAVPDVVHAHFWLSGLAALTATASVRRPVVLTYHGLAAAERRSQNDRNVKSDGPGESQRADFERTLGGLADRVVAQSEDEVAELGRLGVRRAATVVVPSGVDGERFTPTGPAADHRRPGLRRILAVGPLEERKGFADLVEALIRVPGAELLIVGGGVAGDDIDRDPEAVRLMRLADRLGVADRLRIVGAVSHDDLPAWYRSADVLACAPRYEPFGLTPLEAMSCGVPVVAYATGGIAESVIDNVTGVLVPPRDRLALAGALRGLLADEVRRMSFASAAIDRVRSRYTWERAATDLERVYHSLTGDALTADADAIAGADADPAAEEADEDDEALTDVVR